MCTYN
jgi:hypothetical protein